MLIFFQLSDTEEQQLPEKTLARQEKKQQTGKQEAQPKEQSPIKEKTRKKQESETDKTQTATQSPKEKSAPKPGTRTPAYRMPQSRNLASKGRLTLGQSADMQFDGEVFTIIYENRSLAGERLYRLEVIGVQHSRHMTFSRYDSLEAFHIADLNSNGKPEIYLIWISDGSGSYGMIEGQEIEEGSFTAMQFPEQVQVAGYRGYDAFRVYPDYIEHSYPVYRRNDPNSNNTGGIAYHRYSFAHNNHTARVKTMK